MPTDNASHRLDAADIDRAQAISLADIAIARGFVLKRSGRELVGPCPLCGGHDRFAINVAEQLFNCRGCFRQGSAAPDEPRRTGSMRRACCACLRYLRGDHQACSMVRVPTPEEEDAKRTHREREKLVQERQRIENRIEALLFTQGIRKRPALRSWERDLAVLRTGDGREIPRHLRAELDRLRRRLVITLELIREVEAERDQAAKPSRRIEPATR